MRPYLAAEHQAGNRTFRPVADSNRESGMVIGNHHVWVARASTDPSFDAASSKPAHGAAAVIP